MRERMWTKCVSRNTVWNHSLVNTWTWCVGEDGLWNGSRPGGWAHPTAAVSPASACSSLLVTPRLPPAPWKFAPAQAVLEGPEVKGPEASVSSRSHGQGLPPPCSVLGTTQGHCIGFCKSFQEPLMAATCRQDTCLGVSLLHPSLVITSCTYQKGFPNKPPPQVCLLN